MEKEREVGGFPFFPSTAKLRTKVDGMSDEHKENKRDQCAATLAALRTELAARGWDACVVPDCDAHRSEFVAASDKRLRAVTGGRFTGDSGIALVDRTRARVFVDSRFWLQAAQELAGTEWQVVCDGKEGEKSLAEFLAEDAEEHCRGGAPYVVGVDSTLVTPDECSQMTEKASATAPVKVVCAPPDVPNIVDVVWKDRPCPTQGPCSAFVLDESAAGGPERCVGAKLAALRAQCLASRNDSDSPVAGFVVSGLEDICWLLNIRGNAVPCMPVVKAYAVVRWSPDAADTAATPSVTLFVDSEVVADTEVQRHLTACAVTVMPYADVFAHLSELAAHGVQLCATQSGISVALREALEARPPLLLSMSPLAGPRAVKTRQEVANMARAHTEDSLAAVRLLALLEAGLAAGDADVCSLDEWGVCEMLESVRRKSSGARYLGPSFPTIAGYGANGAVVHHEPSAEHPGKQIGTESLLLLDFGGQYAYGGTTDTTRTVHFGVPTAEQRRAFTIVLRSHIALASTLFPNWSTTAADLDTIARAPMSEVGLEYGHGTGHGIGTLLAVHENPVLRRNDKTVIERFAFLTHHQQTMPPLTQRWSVDTEG